MSGKQILEGEIEEMVARNVQKKSEKEISDAMSKKDPRCDCAKSQWVSCLLIDIVFHAELFINFNDS
jgi:hypothetical protein